MKKLLILALLLLAACTTSPTGKATTDAGDAQVVMIGLDRQGYTPREIIVESGRPVILRNDGSIRGCAFYLVQPELGINANLANGDYTFTPTKKGTYDIACSMGMWTGKLVVK